MADFQNCINSSKFSSKLVGWPGSTRVLKSPDKVSLNEWNTVAFTRRGTQASLDFKGVVTSSTRGEEKSGADGIESSRRKWAKTRRPFGMQTEYLDVGNELFIGSH